MSSNAYNYSRLPDEPGDDFVAATFQKQQQIMEEQDEDLQLVGESVSTLKHMSYRIGDELEEQSRMLSDLGNDMERTESKLDGVMKKMAKLTHMDDDSRQWKAIFILIGLIIFLFMLLIVL
uniref:t-SNARE coiled-coil homology domain-containing protein n=1 Tax=Steinernema glaseri TaxID=37863 RepID=A0A1I7ZVU0_9BILA